MQQTNQRKNVFLSVIGVAILVVAVIGVSFAFFNYSRTGPASSIGTGTISFNATNTSFNLTDAFPVTATVAGNTNTATANVGIATVNVTGSTTYSGGIDFEVTAYNVSSNIGTGAGKLPVKAIVSIANMPTGTTYLGTGTATTITEGASIASGNIPGNGTAVNGTITIKAFIDDTNLLVTDTDSTVSISGYTNNTDTTGKTVLTTTEWNALHSTPATFQIRVDAHEHTGS